MLSFWKKDAPPAEKPDAATESRPAVGNTQPTLGWRERLNQGLASTRDFLIVLPRISATKAKPIDAAIIVPVSKIS